MAGGQHALKFDYYRQTDAPYWLMASVYSPKRFSVYPLDHFGKRRNSATFSNGALLMYWVIFKVSPAHPNSNNIIL